jgi:Holliday junction resolvase RusA-like endonuclease
MLLYKAVVHIVPVAQERPRVRTMINKVTKKPFAIVYDPPKSKEFKKDLQKFFTNDMINRHLIEQPIILSCRVFIERPKSVTRDLPCVKPDLSNYVKGIEDAMNGLVYKDDSKIVGYKDCFKAYSEHPRIEVTLFSTD